MMFDKINTLVFYLFIFFLPWQTILILKEIKVADEKFQYGTVGVYFFEIILFLWILFNLFVLKKCSNKKLLLSVLLFASYATTSTLWASNKATAFYFLIPLLLGILSFIILQKRILSFKKFTFVFILSVLLQGILGICQFLNQTITSNKWLGISEHLAWEGGTSVIETSLERFLRAYGGMSHPNILGGFLVIALLLGIGAYLKIVSKEHSWKHFLLVSILINFFALLMTFSRSALLALFLGLFLLLIYYLYHKRSFQLKRFLSLIAALSVICILFIYSYSDLLANRFQADARLEKKSLDERLLYIHQAKEIIASQPLLGTGLGNYADTLLKNKNAPQEIWRIQPVHNIYLLIFAELGIMGFSLFLFIILFVIYDFLESFVKENTNRVIFSTIILSLLVLSLFDHWLWTTHSGIIVFWLLLSFSKEKPIDHA